MKKFFMFLMCLIGGAKASAVLHTVNLSGVVGGPTEEELTTMIQHFNEKLNTIKKKHIELSVVEPYEGKGFISIEGLREEPIYLYQREIKKIFEMEKDLNNIMKTNKAHLA